jgi:hypothetical protein
MPHLILILALAFAALAPSTASAQMEAQEVLWYCAEFPPEGSEPEQYWRYSKCLGYLQGAHDMMAYLLTYGGAKNELYCIPTKGISVDQLRRVVIKWIKDNPAMMNATARQAIQWAMIEAFPCRKKSPPPERQSEDLPPPPRMEPQGLRL